MWIEFSKLVLCFYFCSTVGQAYQSKLDYIKRSELYSGRNAVSDLRNYNFKVSKSRYPNLEKVKNRIENMNIGGGSSKDVYKIRHKGWANYRPIPTTTTTTTTTENDLFETYGDLDDEDLDDYDDNLEDEDDEFDYDDESEDPFSDDFADIQAEEPTERPTVAPKPMSSFTEYKWRHYGSASDVAESRRNHIKLYASPERRRVNAVVEHSNRVNQQGKCQLPSPKVIPVQKEHPDLSKTYTPHCTVLHRCGEDTGCCKYGSCQYKDRDLVQLYFYTTILGSRETKIEKLTFYNHTECECREKSNETSTEGTSENPSTLSFRSADSYNPSEDRCLTCPKHFRVSTSHRQNSCACDCDEDNLDCIQLKKGNEHLSMTDRICISNNECTVPTCEYGTYSRKEGKCPSLTDKMNEFRRIRINY